MRWEGLYGVLTGSLVPTSFRIAHPGQGCMVRFGCGLFLVNWERNCSRGDGKTHRGLFSGQSIFRRENSWKLGNRTSISLKLPSHRFQTQGLGLGLTGARVSVCRRLSRMEGPDKLCWLLVNCVSSLRLKLPGPSAASSLK